MAKVRARHDTKKLFIDFMYKGERYPEQTMLSDTPANRKPALFMSTKTRRFWQNPARFPLIGCFPPHTGEGVPQHMADSVMGPTKSDIYVGD